MVQRAALELELELELELLRAIAAHVLVRLRQQEHNHSATSTIEYTSGLGQRSDINRVAHKARVKEIDREIERETSDERMIWCDEQRGSKRMARPTHRQPRQPLRPEPALCGVGLVN